MKPNIEQERLIGQMLRSILKFKDTYDEVYDHIISAFDALPDDVHFTNALNNIIAYDFGGAKGLKAIERKHTWFSIRQFITDYLKALLVLLTSLIILVIMAGTGLLYFLIASGWLERRNMLLVVMFIPISVLCIAIFKFRRQAKSLQASQQFIIGSIRQNIIAFSGVYMLFFPMFFWSAINSICHKLKYGEVPPSVCAIVFFLVILHTFAGYKMYTVNTGMYIK